MRQTFVYTFAAAVFAASVASDTARAEGRLLPQRKPLSWLDPNCPIATTPPGAVAPETNVTPADPNAPAPQPSPAIDANPQFAPIVSAALGDSSFAVAAPGYIDFAKPMSQIRFRYDSAYNMNRPDRAEFFYPKCGCFGGNAPGPILPERNVDSQEPDLYVEVAPTEKFSVFIDVPYRIINPDANANASGFGDLRYGFKYAFVYDEEQILTFQLRGYAPTGDARRGLGTSHNTIEPALLYNRKLSEKLTLYAEFADWIPIDGTDFAGNVLIYGAGLGYTAYDSGSFRVTPLVEFIGWTVLNGQQFDPTLGQAANAEGDTIVNGKIGVRAGGPRQDIYVGYGRALTGLQWYQDIVRLEYRIKF